VEDIVELNYASVLVVIRSRKENPVLIERKAKLEKQAVYKEKCWDLPYGSGSAL
jgi:hypothetical protein